MDIKPILSLNRHPRDCEDFSLIDAQNVKLTLDQSVLVTEESIEKNDTVKKAIDLYYGDKANINNGDDNINDLTSAWKIIGCIACPDELVLFIYNSLVTPPTSVMRAIIVRYNVSLNMAIITYTKDGGVIINSSETTINGAFTYNVENSLIIAIAEHDGDDKLIPLRTINLGLFNEINNNTIASDLNVKDELLSCTPNIYIPNIKNINYIKGSTYKGWYYFFIRIKINKVDYTQWFSFGNPIFIDSIEEVNIIKHGFNQNINSDKEFKGTDNTIQRIFANYPPVGYVTGCGDNISNSSDIATTTTKFNIVFNKEMNNLYGENFTYQIGVICSSKKYTKGFKSFDITNDNDNIFIISPKNMIEYSATLLIADNYNYFNVKNVTSYKNQLYIASYKESNINNDLSQFTNTIECSIDTYTDNNNDDLKYNVGLIKLPANSIPIDPNGDEDIKITESEFYANDKQSYQFDSIRVGDDIRITLDKFLKVEPNTNITVAGIRDKAKTFYIYRRKTTNKYNVYLAPISLGNTNNNNVNVQQGNVNISIGDIQTTSNVVKINLDSYYMIQSIPYINTKNSFEYRCKTCTLIPGEVYNFYIHYIDKYGQPSNGYRIKNNTKITNTTGDELYPIKIILHSIPSYICFPVRQKVLIKDVDGSYKLNIDNMSVYMTFKDNVLSNNAGDFISYKNYFKDHYSTFCSETYANFEWWQLCNIDNSSKYNYYYNNNNECLFKVPNAKEKDNVAKFTHYYPKFSNIVIPKDYIGYFISYEKFESIRSITGILTNNDFRVNHYNAVFNHDDDKKLSNSFSDIVFSPLNAKASNKMKFYSSSLDISDKIKFDYDIMEVKRVKFAPDKYKMYWQQFPFFSYPKDLNKPLINLIDLATTSNVIYPIPKYKLSIADSARDDRMGLGTCIEMDSSYGLFSDIVNMNETNVEQYPMYIATLINPTRNLYMNKEKILIRCGDIVYNNNGLDYSKITIDQGLNGKITYDGSLIYDGHGVSFNETTAKLTGLSNNAWYYPVSKKSFSNADLPINYDLSASNYEPWLNSYTAYTPFCAYMQFSMYDTYMHESKSFNNAPKPIVYPIFVGVDKKKQQQSNISAFAPGCMVVPANSIDLFENRQSSSDEFNPKTYINYRDDLTSITFFDKTLRRSNIIQDESRTNGWRTFSVEGYKNITENKGKITNLYGVGSMFLVHTEHSLFMFDTDNVMKTDGKDIQLNQVDTFEVAYKEVLTSDLGYGGLQDNKSWIADQFGYFFYNKDFNRFFIFDNGQLGNPDEEIVEFLNKYKPYKCIFANDKVNHRLLIKMNYIYKSITNSIIISFNYDTKKFISRHTYDFNIAYNTKSRLFLQFNDMHFDTLYEFVKDESSYSIFKNMLIHSFDYQYVPVWEAGGLVKTTPFPEQVYVDGSPNPYFVPAKLSIVVNSRYATVKFIEYITYKLYKINTNTNFSPVEERISPFSGVALRVYNDQIDTGILNILITSDGSKNLFEVYDKPYWDLGNWNFSYLRNIKGVGFSDEMSSRLYGNWFIVEMTINNDDNKVEFENLMVNLTKDRMI